MNSPLFALRGVWLLWAVLLVLVLSTPVGASAVPASWGGLLLGLSLLSALLWADELARRRPWGMALLVGLLTGLTAGHVLLLPGMPYSHDGGTHLWGLYAVARALQGEGIFSGWVAELGAGMPLLQHYGPLAYLPGVALLSLGLTVMDAFKGLLLLALVGAGATMYAAMRRLSGSHRAALVAAVAYGFAPYHLLDTHYRGALGEALALVFFPTLLESFTLHLRRESGAWLRLALATAGLALTHPVSLFIGGVGLGMLGLARWLRREPWLRPFLETAWPALLALLATSVWLLPAVSGLRDTSVSRLFYDVLPAFGEHGVHLAQLFTRQAFWGRLPSYTVAEQPLDGTLEMPFYVGLGLLGLGLGQLLLRKQADEAPDPLLTPVWDAGTLLLGGLALSWLPVAQALAPFPGFAEVRYPWRFLGLASLGAALLVGLLVARLERLVRPEKQGGRWFSGLMPAMLLLLGLDALPMMGAPDWVPAYQGVVHWVKRSESPGLFRDTRSPVSVPVGPEGLDVAFLELPPSDPSLRVRQGLGTFAEYQTPTLSSWLKKTESPPMRTSRLGIQQVFVPTQAQAVLPGEGQPYARGWNAQGQEVPVLQARPGSGGALELAIPAGLKRLALREQASPGWELSTQRGEWLSWQADDAGLLTVELPAGTERIRLRHRPPGQGLGLLLSLLGLGGLGLYARGKRLSLPSLSAWHRLSESTQDRLLVSGLALGLLGFRIQAGSLENGTDTIYGIAIQSLVRGGDWLAPAVHGAPYLMKPPLYFWLGGVSGQLLGLNELSLRLPGVLGGVLAVLATFEVGKRLHGRALGWLAVVLLLGCPPFFEFSRRVYMDALLAGLVAASVWAFLEAEATGRRYLWMGVLTGLAMLTKSYAGAFGVAACVGWLLCSRPRQLGEPRLLAGLGVAGLLPLPWIVFELLYHREVFLDQNLAVFRLQKETPFSWHPVVEHFYWVEMLAQAPLFTWLTVGGLGVASWLAWRQDRRWLVPLFWLVGPVTLYWQLIQQRIYYLQPILPGAALLAGLATVTLLPERWLRRVGLGLALVGLHQVAPYLLPDFNKLNVSPGIKAVAQAAGPQLPPGATLWVWNDFFAGPEFYSGHPAVQWTPSASLAEEIGRILVVGKLGVVEYVPAPGEVWQRYWQAQQSGTPFYLLIHERELLKLAPGFVEGWIVAESAGRMVISPTRSPQGRPVAELKGPVDGYLEAARRLAELGRRSQAAQVCRTLALHHPEVAGRALGLAAQLEQPLPAKSDAMSQQEKRANAP